MTDKVTQVFCFFPPAMVSNQQGRATLTIVSDEVALFECTQSSKSCSSQLYPCVFWVTTSGLCIEMKVYHVEPSVADVELGSQTARKARRGIPQPFPVLHLP